METQFDKCTETKLWQTALSRMWNAILSVLFRRCVRAEQLGRAVMGGLFGMGPREVDDEDDDD